MKIGELQIDILANMARLQTDMNELKRSVGGSMQYVQQAAEMAKTAMIGLVGVGSVAAFAGMIRSSIEGAAALNDLAIQSGLSVDQLSALAEVGKTTNTSAEAIASASVKLSKNLAGATEESKGASAALRAMGISFDQFVAMSPDDQMLQLARSMDKYADGSGKSAAAQALLGKEGAKLLPFLKDLAQTGELQARVTAEQAAQADQFSDNLTMLRASGEGWKRELAMGMVPALSTASQAVLDVMNSTGGLRDEVRRLSADGTLKAWTYSAIEGFTYLMDGVTYLKRALVTVGETIASAAAQSVQFFGGVGAAIVKVSQGDFGGAVEAIKAGYSGLSAIGQAWAADQEKAWGEQTIGSKIRGRVAELKDLGTMAEAVKPQLDLRSQLDGNAAAAKRAADEYAKLIEKINGLVAASEMQLTAGTQLSPSQKEALGLMVRLRDGTLQLSESQKIELSSRLDLLLGNERHIATMDDESKLQAEMLKDREAMIEALGKQTATLQEQVDKEAEENLHLQLGDEAYQRLLISRMRDIAAQRESIAATSDQSEELMRQAALWRQRADQAEQGIVLKEAKAAADEWKKTTDQIGNGLTDSLMRAFESGKGFMQAFRDTLVNTFKTLVLRPIIQPIVNGMSNTLGGLGQGLAGMLGLGGSGGAMAGTSGSMLSMLGSGGGMLGSLVSGGSNFLAGIGAGFGESLSMGAGLMEAGATMGGLGAMVGSVAPYLAAAYALYKMLGSGGTPHVGAMLTMDAAGNATALAGQEKYTKAETWNAVSAIGGSALQSLNTLSKTFGGLGGYTGRFGFKADGEDASYGYLSIINRMGKQVAGWSGTGSDWRARMKDYQVDATKSLESYTKDVAAAVRGTLTTIDMPKWAKDSLNALGSTVTLDQLNAAAAQISQTNAQLLGMSSNFAQLGGIFGRIALQSSDAQYQLAQFSGGIDKLISNASSFVQQYYSSGEQQGLQAASLLSQFKALGLTEVPQTLTDFRKLVEGQNLQTEEGRLRVAALLEMSSQFASVQQYLTDQGTTLADLAKLAPQGAVFAELTNAQQRQAEAAAAQAELAARQATAAESTAASIVSLGDLLGGKLDALRGAIDDGLSSLRQAVQEQGY